MKPDFDLKLRVKIKAGMFNIANPFDDVISILHIRYVFFTCKYTQLK